MEINCTLPDDFKAGDLFIYSDRLINFKRDLTDHFRKEIGSKVKKIDIKMRSRINVDMNSIQQHHEAEHKFIYSEDGTEIIVPWTFYLSTSKGRIINLPSPDELVRSLNYVLRERVLNEYKTKFKP